MGENAAKGAAGETMVVEPRTQQWLDELAAVDAPPIYELSPDDARAVLLDVQRSVEVDLAPAEIDDRTIEGGPAGSVDLRIVRPHYGSDDLPVIVHTHGGGWILGDKDTHERLMRELADATPAVVVFVDYSRAPEAQYPTQIEQAYTALEWAAAHPEDIGAAPDRIALFGESVGGNMAAALTLMTSERSGPQLAAQALLYPVTNADLDTATYNEYADGPWLLRESMRWFWDAYLPDEDKRSEPTASPLQASMEQLRGLPPALVINGEHDVLRGEGEAYARKLSQAGVPVTQVRYAGTIHDFALLNPITETPAPRAAIAQAAEFLRRALVA